MRVAGGQNRTGILKKKQLVIGQFTTNSPSIPLHDDGASIETVHST